VDNVEKKIFTSRTKLSIFISAKPGTLNPFKSKMDKISYPIGSYQAKKIGKHIREI
jgi:hypothetical protein